MNLHLFQDEKYVDYFIHRTASLGYKEERFVVYTTHKREKPLYVKSENIHFCQYGTPDFGAAVGEISQYKKVYIHYLSTMMAEFVNTLPKSIKIIWIFWGADGLETLRVFAESSLYQPSTLELYKKWKLKSRMHFKEVWRWLKKEIKGYLLYKNHIKAARRCNYVATLIPEDYALIQKKHQLTARFIPYFYTTVAQMVPQQLSVKNVNVFLGNSASFTNNHVEILEKLARLALNHRKVLCPLSYGIEEYKEMILEKGKILLGHHFQPLTTFLHRDEYYQHIESACVAIMNHSRQQGLGNIIAFLMSGARIYMSNESTLYRFLVQNGLILFSVQEDFLLGGQEILNPLTSEQIEHNRLKITELFGEEAGENICHQLLNL